MHKEGHVVKVSSRNKEVHALLDAYWSQAMTMVLADQSLYL